MRLWICCLAWLAMTIPTTAIAGETVLYEHDGTTLEGYMAWPEPLPDEPLGAVIVVHEWKGLDDYARMRADMLAELGYIAFAADIYGQGVRPQTTQEAGELAGKYRGDRPLLRGRMLAALDTLLAHPSVDPGRVAAIGYCFGGSAVLELARSGADVAGVVSFHGSLGTDMPAEPDSVQAQVLVLHGAADPHVPWEHVTTLAEELDGAGVDWQLVAYSGAMHSFTNPSSNNPEGGSMYDETADQRSWQDMLQFFAELGL